MEKSAKHTMKDVERFAGVSIATVSAVISESANVSAKRKAQVEYEMSVLDYPPDAVARSLRNGSTRVVGVVVPHTTNAFYPEVIRGIEEAARDAGYSVLLCDSREDPIEEEKHLAALFSSAPKEFSSLVAPTQRPSTLHTAGVVRWCSSTPPGRSGRTNCYNG